MLSTERSSWSGWRIPGSKVRVTPEQITNFSLAARKAWVTEPDRAVGRRKGTKLSDRVSVTLRLDRDLWEQFLGLEEDGRHRGPNRADQRVVPGETGRAGSREASELMPKKVTTEQREVLAPARAGP